MESYDNRKYAQVRLKQLNGQGINLPSQYLCSRRQTSVGIKCVCKGPLGPQIPPPENYPTLRTDHLPEINDTYPLPSTRI